VRQTPERGRVRARTTGGGNYGSCVPGTTPDPHSPVPAAARREDRGAARAVPSAGRSATVLPDDVEVRRSARRRRTVTAYRESGRTVVLIPAAFSPAEERRWVAQMVAKLQTREERRRRSLGGDDELMARARALSEAHFDGVPQPASVRWVDNQQRRWGSCTPADRTIRLSSRLRTMPEYVVDYVLVHELAHLIEPSHDARFWALVARYPRAERARGFLEGVEVAQTGGGSPSTGDDDPVD
jgi:predicted metal-dependent hydrolase